MVVSTIASMRLATRSHPSFLPLVPEARALAPLMSLAAELVREAHRLGAQARPLTPALAPLLRAMNSYYTNKIEGQHTRPYDIERALVKDFDADQGQAAKQRLALAHIDAEVQLEAATRASSAELFEASFVQDIHRALYQRLPEADRTTKDHLVVVPGAWRQALVTAGKHTAPPAEDIPRLLASWAEFYSSLPGIEQRIIGAACSHHRLLWVHPFLDGNGRTARLHTHLVFVQLGLSHGVWSPLRGMARAHEEYYARLANADLPRRNDLDGRGSLSQEELCKFASWLIELCIDQVQFMRKLLELTHFKVRIHDLLQWLAAHPWDIGVERSVVKLEALEAVHYVALTGSLERARFLAMTGLPPRTARRVLASLLDFGLLVATGPRAPVSFNIPLASLRFLFPRLWPEAEHAGPEAEPQATAQ